MSHPHPGFEFIRRQSIEALNIQVEEYRHRATGAQHIHIAADSNENVFLVALRTVPQDSTGVAHILEHTALCGSGKYPVRDPFFMMIRRSLNTFMNAFTSSDWTAYPFASQNRKDFNNLLDVYLDAVFFARLDELDFAQEGHRVEFAETTNPDSELVFKGVVFNEMKGAMSSVPAQLWSTLCKYLYPSTTYRYNSGGDPDCIPDLTYEQLQNFYRVHYHPGNAIFMTYGDIPAVEHQQKFEDQVLSRFGQSDTHIAVPDEKRYYAPVRIEESYPLDTGEDSSRKTHVVLAWLLGKSTHLEQALAAQMLSHLLLDNSASPLQHLLETTELGEAPSPLCGLEDSQRELAFICGLEGCEGDSSEAVEQEILATLQRVADEGIDQQQLEAALHQLELQQREVGGDGYPYGLQLLMSALTSATHRGDPIALLDVEAALAKLREQIQKPDFIQTLIRELLLENPHRVRLTLQPDAGITARKQVAEKARLAALKADLSEADKQAVIKRSLALLERQQQQDDDSILPGVTLADIPESLHYTAGTREEINSYPLRCYAAGTNGLVYQQVVCKLPALDDSLLPLLPWYTSCLTELGCGDRDYLENQRYQAQVVGSLNAFTNVRGQSDDVQDVDAYLTLSSKALIRNHAAMNGLLFDTLHKARFDELPRLQELITQARARREQSITGQGHSLAMTAASAGMSPAARLSHQLGGLEGIVALKEFDQALEDQASLQDFANKLARIHQLVLGAPRQFLLVAEEEHLDTCRRELADTWPASATAENFQPLTLPPVNARVQEAWLTATQVSFCAKAYPTVPSDHPDAAALTVLGGFLRNGFLHRAIREQGGAYGGGASQDNNIAAFRFYSYRDPRMTGTLDDFDAALEWLQNTEHTPQALQEAILGVIGSMDKPGSPAGEAKQTFQAELFGRTREKRERFRARILQVSLEDLQRVARTWLQPGKASIAVVTHSGLRESLENLGLTIRQL